MEKKQYIIGAIILVLVSGGTFAAGTYYGMHKGDSKGTADQNMQDGFRNGRMNGGEGAGANRMQGGDAASRTRGAQMLSRFVGGEVLSNDGTSFTLKLRDGGSRIVFVSPTTKVQKNVESTAAEISVGKSVTVNGESTSDGNFIATDVQVR